MSSKRQRLHIRIDVARYIVERDTKKFKPCQEEEDIEVESREDSGSLSSINSDSNLDELTNSLSAESCGCRESDIEEYSPSITSNVGLDAKESVNRFTTDRGSGEFNVESEDPEPVMDDSDALDISNEECCSTDNSDYEMTITREYEFSDKTDLEEEEDTSSLDRDSADELGVNELFAGATVSNEEFSIAMLTLFQKHNLTYSTMTDVLKLFTQILPSPNAVPPTNFVLMNKFMDYKANIATHRCCGHCTSLLPADGFCSQMESQSYVNIKEFSFIQLHLDKQLNRFFSGSYTYVHAYTCRCGFHYNIIIAVSNM